jgi:hypothetical protein
MTHATRRLVGAKTNQWDKYALETRLDRWLRLQNETKAL